MVGHILEYHVYHLYVVGVPDRPRVVKALRAAGVASEVYYPYALHLLEPFRHLGYREGDFPISERACRELLAIPIFPETTDEQRNATVVALAAALAR